jgi:CheY-like chemotaxis protein
MTATPTGSEPGSLILIVDDNEMGLLARKQVLRELGHRVTVVSSAQEAIRRFTSEPFDLVVTDYKMPDMDGMEIIRRARAHNPAIPIILISGFTNALGLNESTTGADVVLQKSATEVSQLIRAVNRLLRKSLPPKKRVTLQKKSAAASSKRAG